MNDICNYSTMSKVFLWVNSDMDGAVSTILLGNIFPNMEYRYCFFGNFQEQYLKWEKTNLSEYDKVFVVGMVLDQSLVNKIDDYKVVFISDKKESIKTYDSTLIAEETTSCSKLIYQKFSKKIEFSLPMKLLVAYADDYNSYKLTQTESKYLNAVYRTISYNRFGTFVNRFWSGYDGFTDDELERVKEYYEEIEREVASLELYEGVYKDWKVLATFSKCPVNEISHRLIDNYDHDVIIVVNLDTKFVSFRKPIGSPADIEFMAEKLCDGGGSEYSAGGQMTQKFLDLTTTLIQI